jgi:hypothetical protein
MTYNAFLNTVSLILQCGEACRRNITNPFVYVLVEFFSDTNGLSASLQKVLYPMVVQAKLETQWTDVSTTFSEADLRQVDPDLASLPLLIPAFKKVWSYNSPEWVQQLKEVFARKKRQTKKQQPLPP